MDPDILVGIFIGLIVWFLVRYLAGGIYTVDQNQRAVKTNFGRADRIPGATTLNDPISAGLDADEKQRYRYPQVRVIMPGGPYFKWPWQKIYKVSIATQTVNMAFDPDAPGANQSGTVVDAVTKDQLNTGLTGQIRYHISERNLYANLFGAKRPISHVMGYFVSVLRERIATFEAPAVPGAPEAGSGGVSINDLRKNLRDLNEHMDRECSTSEARYGIVLDASLITGIDPPPEVESALNSLAAHQPFPHAALQDLLEHEADGSAEKHAKYFRDKVIPTMNALREAGDSLEGLVPHDLWPLPTYREMLFVK